MAAESLASDDTSFALAFYGPAVAAVGSGQNVIVSPYSISATLTMVDVGASGETAAQIETVLHLPGTGATAAPAYASLACEDETDGSSHGNQLYIADSLWGQEGKAFESSFLSMLSVGYNAPLQQVNFGGNLNAAANAINTWVSNATQSKVPALLQSGDISGSTQLVLVSAMYFKGVWDVGFDPNSTVSQPFTLSNGMTVSVPTMSGTVNLGMGNGGAANQGLSVYELPYKGGSLVMDFLLPTDSLSALEASLTPSTLTVALGTIGSSYYQVNLLLPKFSFTTRLALDPLLSAMGMSDVFDPEKADLSGMDGAMDLYVSTIVHEALVQVDEQGTVAAAGTAATIAQSEIAPSPVMINRPFLFLIRDTKNGSILFIGGVEDPSQGS